jgi:protein-disulfide isomerase
MSRKKRERNQVVGDGSPVPESMTGFYWLLGVVAMLGIGVVGYAVVSRSEDSTVSQPIGVVGLEDPGTLMSLARGVEKGNAQAPITIIEFADFQCPVCAEFERLVKPFIEAEFVNTGRARFVFYDFPLSIHPNAFLAARAARCAEDQGKFWEYHDNLFQNQSEWSPIPSPAGMFEDYAALVGLERSAFGSCLRSDRHADVVTANMALATQLQVPGTPTILVAQGRGVGRRVPHSIEGIREAVMALEGGSDAPR